MSDWHVLKGRIQRAMLSGEIALRQGGYDSPQGHSRTGLDFGAHLDLLDILSALTRLRAHDKVAYLLLRRDIGEPCKRHRPPSGHCHRISLDRMPALKGMTWEELEEGMEEAIGLLDTFYS